jgi:glycosyl hydrolase family 67
VTAVADREKSSHWTLLLAAVVVLALGAGVAYGVNGMLGLSFTPVSPPVETATAAPSRPDAPAPAFATIGIPPGHRLEVAAAAVADALVARGQPRPTIGASAQAGLSVRIVPAFASSPEAFRFAGASDDAVTVEASDVAGAAAALYTIADRIRSGEAVVPPTDRGAVISPRLPLRLTDAGSVGREADVAAFRAGDNYSLNSDVVGSALLRDPPYVDAAATARIASQFRQFVDHSLQEGYNGVVVPGFLEYVTFAAVPGIYPAGDPHVARAKAMVEAFAPVFRYAHDMGMRVFLMTDMLALSPPLRDYLTRTYGGLAVEDPAFWSVYQAALSELFSAFPFADGLMIRIGEGGGAYHLPGWDYASQIAVTTPAAVRAMLRAFLATAGAGGRDIIFRTWTVGFGAVGDLHTNPQSYAEVLGGLDDPHLIVSTKYVQGDFYSHLPLNPTLRVGTQRRIIEFQARREFEGFGAFPNDMIGLSQQALREFLAANPKVEGVWNWTQDGGPLRAGPMSLYLRAGFWPLYDLNTYGVGRLAWNPDTDPARITADWARQSFSDDPSTVAAVGEAMALSREAINRGLYIGPYADNAVKALGLEPPPMMWIFEWDIITGDSSVLDSIYAVSRDRLDDAIADGDRAIAVATRMRDAVAATNASAWRDPEQRQSFVDSLNYELDVLKTLGAYRSMVLRHVQWLDTGDREAHDAWQQAQLAYSDARAAHVARYQGDVNWPAFNFTAADLGAVRADRDLAMAWLARGLLLLLLIALFIGWFRPGAVALRALWLGATQPWRLASLEAPTGRLNRVLVWAIPAAALVVSRATLTWFAAPTHLGVTLGAWLLYALALRLLLGRRDPFHLWAAIGGVALLRTVILLLALSTRGPGRYWLLFWTAPTSRSAYITVGFAAFCWLFVVTAIVLRRHYGLTRRRCVGAAVTGAGLTLAVVSGVVAAIGLERALTIWNDQMALLPWGLHRILGLTVYLSIPTTLPDYTMACGVALALAGALISLRLPRRRSSLDSGDCR